MEDGERLVWSLTRPCVGGKMIAGSARRVVMLTEYIRAAMRQAQYKLLPQDNTFFGHIPAYQGVWASEPTLEACRDELQSALEDWILFGLAMRDPLPVIDGIDLNVKDAA